MTARLIQTLKDNFKGRDPFDQAVDVYDTIVNPQDAVTFGSAVAFSGALTFNGTATFNNDVIMAGTGRLDFSSLNVKAANTDGGVIKAGTSGARVTEDTANMKFLSFYFDNGALSGDNRGMYLRQYLTGAGGGGEAARIFSTVENVAGSTVHGAHISLSFGTAGSVTGQGIAGRNTLHIPNQSMPGGNVTYSALQAEIFSDGSDSDPAGNIYSFIRVVNGGDAGGKADVDDDAVLFDMQGLTAGAAKLFATGVGTEAIIHNVTASLKVLIGATTYYIPLSTAIT